MTTTEEQNAKKHAYHASLYFENALELLNSGEIGKASELLWGSVAQAVQAVASFRGVNLTSHRSLRYFLSDLARQLNDRTLVQNFMIAEHLHSNFHEVELTAEDVAQTVEPIREALKKLLSLLPSKLTEVHKT